MIGAAVTLVALLVFVWLCRQLDERINRVIRHQRKTHERISQIELKDNDQDQHLYAHDTRLNNQQKAVKRLASDVDEMGKDIGWKDDNRRTHVMKTKDKDPDDAA